MPSTETSDGSVVSDPSAESIAGTATSYPDFTDKYNTPLDPDQSTAYSSWVIQQSSSTGRDISKDSYDYDMQGFYKKNGDVSLSDAHLTDEFKKPNHPTFSNQSIYHGVDGHVGGEWARQPGTLEQYEFTPGPSNYMSIPELKDYFNKVEPQNTLNVPQSFESGGVEFPDKYWLTSDRLPNINQENWKTMLENTPESTNVEDRRTEADKKYEDLATERDRWLREHNLDSSTNYKSSVLRGPISKEDLDWMHQYETDKHKEASDLTIEEIKRQMESTANKREIPLEQFKERLKELKVKKK